MTKKSHSSINFCVQYNWPLGKNSIKFGRADVKKDFQIRVFASKKNKPNEFYTLKSLVDKKIKVNQAHAVFSKNASKGKYLVGDNFHVEVFDNKNKSKKKITLKAWKKRPTEATGTTSIDQQYYFDL